MGITRTLGLAALAAASLFGQYKVEPAGAPPAEFSSVAATLAKDGAKVIKPDGTVLCEMWLVAAEPTGGTAEQNTSFTTIPHGALLGVVRYVTRGGDRRGQQIKPGFYTMRYSYFPMNGDHQGVAPQRDFAILSPAAIDTDAASKPAFDPLMDMGRKASGTPHPPVLSLWKDDAGAVPRIEAQGENDQVLHLKLGSTPLAVIVVGKSEG